MYQDELGQDRCKLCGQSNLSYKNDKGYSFAYYDDEEWEGDGAWFYDDDGEIVKFPKTSCKRNDGKSTDDCYAAMNRSNIYNPKGATSCQACGPIKGYPSQYMVQTLDHASCQVPKYILVRASDPAVNDNGYLKQCDSGNAVITYDGSATCTIYEFDKNGNKVDEHTISKQYRVSGNCEGIRKVSINPCGLVIGKYLDIPVNTSPAGVEWEYSLNRDKVYYYDHIK